MFNLEALAERVPLTPIFQNMTLIYHVQRLANVKKIAKFNLPSIYISLFHLLYNCSKILQSIRMSTFALYGDSYIRHLGRFCGYNLKVIRFFFHITRICFVCVDRYLLH